MNASDPMPEITIVDGDFIVASDFTKPLEQVKPEIIIDELCQIFKDIGLLS